MTYIPRPEVNSKFLLDTGASRSITNAKESEAITETIEFNEQTVELELLEPLPVRALERVNKETEFNEHTVEVKQLEPLPVEVLERVNKETEFNEHTVEIKQLEPLPAEVLERVNKETYEEDRVANVQDTFQRKIDVWQENSQLKQLDSKITEYELCKRNKKWKWTQESDDASEKYKKRFFFSMDRY